MTRREVERVLIAQGCYIITQGEKETILGSDDSKVNTIAITDRSIYFGVEGGGFDFTAKLEDVKADPFGRFTIAGELKGRY